MQFRRMRFRLRTVLILVAISAVVFSYVGQARRRWAYCWMQEGTYASFEKQHRAQASIPNSPYREESRKLAERNGRYKWMWRWQAFRFWEPPELAESATLGG
jgi:hypothetical protein